MDPHRVVVNNSFLLSCKSARHKCQVSLEQAASNKKGNNLNKQEEILVSEIRDVATKRVLLQKTCHMLESDFVDCIKEAGSKTVITQVHKAVALNRKSEETQKEIETLHETIE